MDRQFDDIARVMEELAMNADGAGAENLTFTLQRGKLTAEDDGCGMSEEEFERAKQGMFTTKGARRGNGLKLISSLCGVHMRRTGGKTVITCTFEDLPAGDVAGAVALAAAGDMSVTFICKGEGEEREIFCGAAEGDARRILDIKKRVQEGIIIWREPSGGNYEDNSRYSGYQGEHATGYVHP